MKTSMQISLIHLLVYCDFNMVQILHNDPDITAYTDTVLRLKGTIPNQTFICNPDFEGGKSIMSKTLFRKGF